MKYIKLYEQVEHGFFSAIRYGDIKGIKELIKNGADINIQNKIGRTPLIFSVLIANATEFKTLKIMKLLIDNGAQLDIQDGEGQTALIKASRGGKLNTIEFLIEAGSDISIEDDFGDDFLYFLDEKMVKELEGKYPEKFEEYQMRKDVKNYNI